DSRFAAGRPDRLADFAAGLVRLKVDVIVATSTQATLAAKNATGTIPIVTTNFLDPVGLGLIESLARPGGNITGLSHSVGAEPLARSWSCSRKSPPKSIGWQSSRTPPIHPTPLRYQM